MEHLPVKPWNRFQGLKPLTRVNHLKPSMRMDHLKLYVRTYDLTVKPSIRIEDLKPCIRMHHLPSRADEQTSPVNGTGSHEDRPWACERRRVDRLAYSGAGRARRA